MPALPINNLPNQRVLGAFFPRARAACPVDISTLSKRVRAYGGYGTAERVDGILHFAKGQILRRSSPMPREAYGIEDDGRGGPIFSTGLAGKAAALHIGTGDTLG